MCLVLGAAQCFAISGGPFGGKGLVPVVGSYAGTMNDVVVGSNNMGIFTLSIPQTGLATGSVFIFTGERTFSGPISGLANPNTDVLVATLQGIPVVTSGSTTIETLNLHADGTVNAKIKQSKNSTSISSVRIRGSAHVTTTNQNSGCTVGCNCETDCKRTTDYTVHGFKQSNSGG
ncbi:MAG: hypothetical protein QOI04_1205 [Verrucomicrobiota bacterium]